jgi:AcrR family transcriptional regulator
MGITERKKREKQQRREAIIDAGESVFFSKGLENATMDDVATVAELSKGTLYLYFNSKEQLYLAIIMRGFAILDRLFKEATQNAANGLDKVRAIGRAYQTFYDEYPNYFMGLLYYESNKFSPEQIAELQEKCDVDRTEHSLNQLVAAIEEGQSDGSIKQTIEPLKLALLLWSMSTGVFQVSHHKEKLVLERRGLSSEDVINTFFEFIGESIGTQLQT